MVVRDEKKKKKKKKHESNHGFTRGGIERNGRDGPRLFHGGILQRELPRERHHLVDHLAG